MADDGAMPTREHDVDLFERSRGRLEAIAYRLLGSAGDAENAVQDTYLRWHTVDRDNIEIPEAWLTKVLTNLCLNRLTSARARRETYVGQWLPEPLLDGDRMLGPADTAVQRDTVSMALLTLLERLSPNERVVYVLREAFGYPHREIASILGITEANCQQIHRRARQHIAADRVRAEVDAVAAARIAEQFVAAALTGDTEPLIAMLTADAVKASDVVITMGCGDACPYYPGKRYLDWVLDDPAGQAVDAVRPIRDEIKRRITELLAELD